MRPIAPQVTLSGTRARLEPLREEHAAALLVAARDPAIWRYMLADPSVSLDAMRAWVAEALAERDAGTAAPFVVVAVASDAVVGATRFFDIKPRSRGLEIGHTWLGVAARRTSINTECKYLLLRHAFEDLGAIRVQLKTDRRNDVSQRAIERIGATREGVLRKFQVLADGYQRDTVMYSVIDDEWPAVKARLESLLRAR